MRFIPAFVFLPILLASPVWAGGKISHPYVATRVVYGSAFSLTDTAKYLTQVYDSGGNAIRVPGAPFAEHIDDRGDTVFHSYQSSDMSEHSYIQYAGGDGAVLDMGSLGGNYIQASAINSQQTVVGTSKTVDGKYHAFEYSHGMMYDLHSLVPSAMKSQAIDVSDRGAVVSTWANDTDAGTILSYGDEVLEQIPRGPNSSLVAPAAISDRNEFVVGTCDIANGVSVAVLWKYGKLEVLHTLGGKSSFAYAVNDAGQVVGSSDIAKPTSPQITAHAFIYENGKMKDLNTLVPKLPVQLASAVSVNKYGQILANSAAIMSADQTYFSGQEGYLLTLLPTMTIKGVPKTPITTRSAHLPIHGTANIGSTVVRYLLDGVKHYRKAKGRSASEWRFRANLHPGRNVISVIALGPGGRSKPVTIVVIRG